MRCLSVSEEFRIGNSISLAWSLPVFWKTKLEMGMPNMSVKKPLLFLTWIKFTVLR